MDPNVWGPKMWNILMDLCYQCDVTSSLTDDHVQALNTIVISLQYLLPCRYCRESYVVFLEKVPFPLDKQYSFLPWLYVIRRLVNEKLGKQTPPWKLVEKRMRIWTSASSCYDVWDVLFMLAYNYQSKDTEKFLHMQSFIRALDKLSEVFPWSTRSLFTTPIADEDLQSAKTVMKYFCKQFSQCHPSSRCTKNPLEIYQNLYQVLHGQQN